MKCIIVSYFLCVFFNKIKFLGGLEVDHYWSSEKEGKKSHVYMDYILL